MDFLCDEFLKIILYENVIQFTAIFDGAKIPVYNKRHRHIEISLFIHEKLLELRFWSGSNEVFQFECIQFFEFSIFSGKNGELIE